MDSITFIMFTRNENIGEQKENFIQKFLTFAPMSCAPYYKIGPCMNGGGGLITLDFCFSCIPHSRRIRAWTYRRL